MYLSLAKHQVRGKNQVLALSCIHAPIATFFSPPNVDQTGGECEALRRYKSGLKSRFIALLLKIYTDVANPGFPQVRSQAFDEVEIPFLAGAEQAKNLPLNVPFIFHRGIHF